MIKLFIYGTLKRGKHNVRYMDTAKYLYDYRLPGYKLYTNGHYPMIIKGDGEVYGEIWEIDETTPEFDRIMRLEEGYIPTKLVISEFDDALAFVGRDGLHGCKWELIKDGRFK